MRKSPTSQTEKAFVAYIQSQQANTVLETVSVFAGGLAGTPNTTGVNPSTLQPASSTFVITPPSLIFTASAPEQIGYDSGIYELTLTACLCTEIYDESVTDAEDVHRERLEALRDLIDITSIVAPFVNPPASPPDTREVQNFTLSGIAYEGEDTKMSDTRIETELRYYILMCPGDS